MLCFPEKFRGVQNRFISYCYSPDSSDITSSDNHVFLLTFALLLAFDFLSIYILLAVYIITVVNALSKVKFSIYNVWITKRKEERNILEMFFWKFYCFIFYFTFYYVMYNILLYILSFHFIWTNFKNNDVLLSFNIYDNITVLCIKWFWFSKKVPNNASSWITNDIRHMFHLYKMYIWILCYAMIIKL